jgi:heat shock protein HslJ
MKKLIPFIAGACLLAACTTQKAMTHSTPSLTGTYWKLIEIKGQPVNTPDEAKPYFLTLDSVAGRFNAWAGCNRMMGSFTHPDQFRISFGKAASTMMACPDMTLERTLADVLEAVDNYSIAGKNLSLNRARMAPLARFVAIPEPK